MPANELKSVPESGAPFVPISELHASLVDRELYRRSRQVRKPKRLSAKAIYESLGMVRVRGARGGIYYE